MGNALQLSSCSSSCSTANIMCMTRVNYSLRSGCGGGGAVGGAKVVHTGTGEVVEAIEGTTAAEIMMEHPNHFLICSTTAALVPGKRFMPLASHQEILRNQLYFLLPMHKLRCRLSAQDIALLSHLSHKLKRLPSSVPTPFILPPSALSRGANRVSLQGAPVLSHMHTHVAPVAEHTLLSSFINRTPPPSSLWRPSLETIDETPHLRSWTFREGLVM